MEEFVVDSRGDNHKLDVGCACECVAEEDFDAVKLERVDAVFLKGVPEKKRK